MNEPSDFGKYLKEKRLSIGINQTQLAAYINKTGQYISNIEKGKNNAHPPIKWCTVSLSDVINRGNRLEASVFDVEAKQAWETIRKGKYPLTTIGGPDGMATSYTCARFKRIWVEESDYPIYQPSTIMDIKPTPDGYISRLTETNIEGLRVSKGQVLMTCSGTIGKVSYVSDTLDHLIFSHDLLRINCKKEQDSGYVYTYLKSRIGNKILLTNSYGAVITHIEPEHLANVPIPNAPKSIRAKIHSLVLQSFTLRDESNKLIDEATKILMDELHLPPINKFEVDDYKKGASVETFNVKLSNLAGRADASYHLPIEYIANQTNRFRQYMINLIDSESSEGISYRESIAKLHESLLDAAITSQEYRGARTSVSFSEVPIKNSNTHNRIVYMGIMYDCSFAHGLITTNVTNTKNNNILFNYQAEYNEDDIKSQSDFQHLTSVRQEKCLNCYKELNPYKIESVLLQGENCKKIGAYSFVNDSRRISQAIITILYLLRCCLAHGDISPDEAANEVYKYAYEIICPPLKKLR